LSTGVGCPGEKTKKASPWYGRREEFQQRGNGKSILKTPLSRKDINEMGRSKQADEQGVTTRTHSGVAFSLIPGSSKRGAEACTRKEGMVYGKLLYFPEIATVVTSSH